MRRQSSPPNILFISTYPLPIEKGSNQHAFFMIKALAEKYHVYCLFFLQDSTHSGAELLDHSALFKEINVKETYVSGFTSKKFKNEIQKRINRALAFPYRYACSFNTEKIHALVARLIMDRQIDVVHIESLHYATLMWHIPAHVKKVFVYHDLHHKIFFEQAKFVEKHYNKINPMLDGVKVRFFEQLINKKSDLKIFLNPEEMKFSPLRSAHVPHIVNPEILFTPPRQSVDCINIFFLGGYKHPPNREAFDLIFHEILPHLKKSAACNWIFHLIGQGTEKLSPLIQEKGLSNKVRIRGFVRCINDVFREMDIALFPIPYGGGIKTKIIESMAAGIPVVTTPPGAFGLSGLGDDCIDICKTSAEIVNSLKRLMLDDRLRVHQSQASKAYIEKHHTYESMRKILFDAYKGVL
jgi:glycosyltransferase involved in cell wall biosynthesis